MVGEVGAKDVVFVRCDSGGMRDEVVYEIKCVFLGKATQNFVRGFLFVSGEREI